MSDVSIVGIGQTMYGVLSERTILDVAVEAALDALDDAGVDGEEIDSLYVANYGASDFVAQNHLAPYIGSSLGLRRGAACVHVENACASGGTAVREGVLSIAAGAAQKVLVVGVEMMTTVSTSEVTEILAKAGERLCEFGVGFTFPSAFAMMARRHMYQYGTTREHLASVAVKNHANAARNPRAHMRKPLTMEKVLADERVVADPLRLYDCSLITDGASALVLSRRGAVSSSRAVDVVGVGQACDSFPIYKKDDVTRFDATVEAASAAFSMAGIEPEEVDVFEVHDCFTIAEIMAIEDIGLVPKGEGGPATLDGLTALDGRHPVNPSGGLKAKGHPIGATGVGQIVEIVEQLRGEAGERQVEGAEVGLAHNLGGSGATCVVHILAKR